MRPLGLDGVVGAPAIVRTNPLLRVYGDIFAPYTDSRSCLLDRRSAVRPFLPFSWRDVLGVVQERYMGSPDPALTAFLSACAGVLPDRVLVYDLDTPELDVNLSRDGQDPLLSVLLGSCRYFSCQFGLARGAIRQVASGRAAVVLSSVDTLTVARDSFVLYSPDLACAIPTRAVVSDGSVLCSSAPIDYGELGARSVVRGTGDLGVLGHPDRSLLELVDDPLALRTALMSLRSSHNGWRSTPEYRLLRDRTCSDPASPLYSSCRRFTPGGASR